MSTKTLRKRIALVAVAALGAGLLSVAPANAVVTANNLVPGTLIGTNDNATAGSNNESASAGVLNIATAPSLDGTTASSAKSIGLVNVGDIAGTRIAGTTQTAVLLSTGTIAVYTAATARYVSLITVDNGTITGSANAGAFASDLKSIAGAANSALAASIKPASGATSMTIRMFVTNGYSDGSTSWTAKEMLDGDTTGVLTGQITVTIASASTAGTLAASTSGIYYSDSSTDTANTADATSGTWKDKAPTDQFANVRVRDSYRTGLAAGLLQATATNGALVNLSATTGVAGTKSTAFLTTAPDDVMLTVSAPSFAPLTTTVTVTYNGTVVGTKSFTFTGPVAAITLGAPLRIGALSQSATSGSGSSARGATIAFTDSAGNPIYVGSSASGMTAYATSGFQLSAASDRSGILSTPPSDSVTTGYVDWACGSSATTDNLIVSYVNIDGSVVTSQPLKVSCADRQRTFTIGYDKATYSLGELATLTITFRDRNGNLANDIQDWSGTTTSDIHTISVAGGVLSAAASNADTSALGVRKYTVLTGVTEGTYQTVVSIPVITTHNSSQREVVTGFTLKSTSAGVSNADVLKAIVSLIASINKQIAALQKALLKR